MIADWTYARKGGGTHVERYKKASIPEGCTHRIPWNHRLWSATSMDAWLGISDGALVEKGFAEKLLNK